MITVFDEISWRESASPVLRTLLIISVGGIFWGVLGYRVILGFVIFLGPSSGTSFFRYDLGGPSVRDSLPIKPSGLF